LVEKMFVYLVVVGSLTFATAFRLRMAK
jgi:hypothetical protein